MPRIRLRNSVVQGNTPDPANIEIGEVCINAHPDSAALYFKDANDDLIELKPGAVTGGDTAPNAPTEGQLWYDTLNETLNYWDGTAWVELGTAEGALTPTSDQPPLNPEPGQLWWDSVSGQLFIWYEDANSSQWVQASPQAPAPAELWTRTGTELSPANAGDDIVTTGRIGAGTDAPNAQLHVSNTGGDAEVRMTASASGGSCILRFGNNADQELASIRTTSGVDNLSFFGFNDEQRMVIDTNGRLLVGSDPATPAVSLDPGSTGSPLVRDADGNVGVKTATPNRDLSIGDGTTDIIVNLQSDNSQFCLLDFGDPDNAAAGRIGYLNDVDAMTFRTSGAGEDMRLDSAGRLLVGTASVAAGNQAKLVVNNRIGGAGPGLVDLQRGDTPAGVGTGLGHINFSGADTNIGAQIIGLSDDAWTAGTSHPTRLEFFTTPSGSATPEVRAVIDSNGRLGVGTAAPDATFQVRGANGSKFEQSANSAQFFISPGATPSDGVELNTSFGGSGSYGPLKFNTGGSTSATIDSAGRLLVGTATAQSVGDVTSQMQIEGDGQAASSLSITANGGNTNGNAPTLGFGKSRGQADGSNTIVNNGDVLGQIHFAAADGNNKNSIATHIRAWVDGNPTTDSIPGRLVFSTTPISGATPVERLMISKDGRVSTYTTTSNIFYTARDAAADTVAFQINQGATGIGTGTACFVVKSDGDCENSNNRYEGISDIKLKENIVDAKSQWDDIKALRLVNYNFKAKTRNQTYKQLGLIAQEVETICPGLVSESRDTEFIEVPVLDADGVQVMDEDGKPVVTTEERETGEVTKSVAYSVLYLKAIGALQEAMERIEQLETTNASLEARLTALEGGN